MVTDKELRWRPPVACSSEDLAHKIEYRLPTSAESLAEKVKRLVLIIGAPRSGTTWLAKIFDSHPQVLYRHEPDTILRSDVLPTMCPAAEIDRYKELASDYLHRLVGVSTLKTAGSRPIFAKSYLTPAQNRVRKAVLAAGRAAGLVSGKGSAGRLRMPDPVRLDERRDVTVVIKSVSSRGRAGLFAAAAPESRFLFLARHPCGQVASMMRGVEDGRFETRLRTEEMLDTEQARGHGLTRRDLEAMPLSEQLAWHWAILNQKALDDLAGGAKFRQVSYEALCERPRDIAAELFGFAGLSWERETSAFIEASTTFQGKTRYYDVKANTPEIVNRWRSTLDRADQERIIAVARQFPIGRAYGL